jgi:hypothetical protein
MFHGIYFKIVRTIILERLSKGGYEAMLDLDIKTAPHLNSLSRIYSGNRCIRDPDAQWWERCFPLVATGGAVYSISISGFFLIVVLFSFFVMLFFK